MLVTFTGPGPQDTPGADPRLEQLGGRPELEYTPKPKSAQTTPKRGERTNQTKSNKAHRRPKGAKRKSSGANKKTKNNNLF